MEINIKKPILTKEFTENLKTALRKGCSTRLSEYKSDRTMIEVIANNRIVGRFIVYVAADKYEISERLIIEQEFYPLEVALDQLIKKAKKQRPIKIKTIVY